MIGIDRTNARLSVFISNSIDLFRLRKPVFGKNYFYKS